MAKMALKWPFLVKMVFANFNLFGEIANNAGVVGLIWGISRTLKMAKNGFFLPEVAFRVINSVLHNVANS